MTGNIFAAFAIFFISYIQQYRQTLDENLRNKPVILITDNHSSRKNPLAAKYLKLHNIILITLPAHCTHVMQPFDVGVASVLKTKLATLKVNKTIKEKSNIFTTTTARARYLTVSAIIQA